MIKYIVTLKLCSSFYQVSKSSLSIKCSQVSIGSVAPLTIGHKRTWRRRMLSPISSTQQSEPTIHIQAFKWPPPKWRSTQSVSSHLWSAHLQSWSSDQPQPRSPRARSPRSLKKKNCQSISASEDWNRNARLSIQFEDKVSVKAFLLNLNILIVIGKVEHFQSSSTKQHFNQKF